RSVEHGETGLLTVGGSAGFGMPSRFTEWPEMARYRPGSLAAATTQTQTFIAPCLLSHFRRSFMSTFETVSARIRHESAANA
ncbi:hypothetical protein, partial [uncultured Sphingomonas sp.]|uniref:hypothetical protein n=1 Tax=uncultured Sphingomonas sp. TaxID=158754 RepID=UPI0025EF72A8